MELTSLASLKHAPFKRAQACDEDGHSPGSASSVQEKTIKQGGPKQEGACSTKAAILGMRSGIIGAAVRPPLEARYQGMGAGINVLGLQKSRAPVGGSWVQQSSQ